MAMVHALVTFFGNSPIPLLVLAFGPTFLYLLVAMVRHELAKSRASKPIPS